MVGAETDGSSARALILSHAFIMRAAFSGEADTRRKSLNHSWCSTVAFSGTYRLAKLKEKAGFLLPQSKRTSVSNAWRAFRASALSLCSQPRLYAPIRIR